MLVFIFFFSIDKNIVPKYRTRYHPGKDLIDFLTNYNKWTKDFVFSLYRLKSNISDWILSPFDSFDEEKYFASWEPKVAYL